MNGVHREGQLRTFKKIVFIFQKFIFFSHYFVPTEENVNLPRKLLTLLQKCSFLLSFQGEGWCLTYQQKDKLLEKVRKCLPGMFDLLDVNEAPLGLPVNEASLVQLPELTGNAWEQNNCGCNQLHQ